jgi:hypothetical protein
MGISGKCRQRVQSRGEGPRGLVDGGSLFHPIVSLDPRSSVGWTLEEAVRVERESKRDLARMEEVQSPSDSRMIKKICRCHSEIIEDGDGAPNASQGITEAQQRIRAMAISALVHEAVVAKADESSSSINHQKLERSLSLSRLQNIKAFPSSVSKKENEPPNRIKPPQIRQKIQMSSMTRSKVKLKVDPVVVFFNSSACLLSF